MLIRIVRENPGCTFEPGQLIRVGDVQGLQIITAGYGEQVGEAEVQKPIEQSRPQSRVRDNPFMNPPRWIAPDGYVAASEEELANYQCD